jgi:hypothetical protein
VDTVHSYNVRAHSCNPSRVNTLIDRIMKECLCRFAHVWPTVERYGVRALILPEILIIHHLLPALLLHILSVSLDMLSKVITFFIQSVLGLSSMVSSPTPLSRSVLNNADHSGRVVWGMNYCLRPPKRWYRGFESHSRHGYLCAFILCFCCSMCR